MLRQCLFLSLFCLSGWLGAGDAGASSANIVHFDMVYRKDSDLGLKLIRTFAHAFSQAGYRFDVEQFPSRRGIEELKNRRVDGTVARVGDLAIMHGIRDYIRLDVPLHYTTLSLWCNKEAQTMKNLAHPRVAFQRSSPMSTLVAELIEDRSVQVTTVSSYRNMLVMMQRDRLDCLLASDAQLDTEHIGRQELKGVFRHNLITLPTYSWIAIKHKHWKPILEKELRQLVEDKLWKKLYFEVKASCSFAFQKLCPDGRVFARQLGINELIATPLGM